MANTFIEYTGNGSQTNYSFTFEYIKEAEVKVTLDGTASTAFTFANATTLSFTTAPASGVKIRIYRETDVSSLKATFFAGSAIKAEDLNDNFTQNNFAVEELRESTWDFDTETIKSNETWVSSDTQIATTAAMDARFQDEAAETITSSETWPDDDNTIATTAAIDNRIDTAITNDIAGSDGVSITDDGDGTITVGLTDSSVDLDKIKDEDKITYAEQNAGSPSPADTNIFTASAAARRFDTLVQTGTPSGSDWQVGKTWLQNDADKTLSVWDGDSWEGISSGGTFTSQAKVVYVDATNGNDANDGHRISRPKASIKAAINQINADATFGDGSIVVVAPGVYQEACPIQIQKRDVAIVGTSLRQCVIHPTQATETATMFEVNSGSYLKNLTFTGMKASGTRGDTGSLWENSTYGLPPTQGWNVAFYNNAYIYKSPYIQNCTNFSDSEIDNDDLAFYAGTADKGRAGDTDSAPTGGGLLVDGSVPHEDSPLRSIVCDSYTHTGLDAPGIFVTNNGYMQATSSYAFFNHAHITCINGGQANLAASTSDFGRYGLIASGKSTSAIFTSTIDGAVSDGAISFNIDAPTAASGWHGTATRPAGNMLVTVNSVTYPILSATANGSGWTVTISRPDSNNRSTNLGVNGAISDGAAVSFFLRSMIASSGHTMEYVGSGTNYSALPENGGVPVEANQKIELDNGKIWTATTDQNGKFSVGGNQTDDPFFEVDQQLGFVTIPEGSIAFNLLSDTTPQLGGDLDVNGNEIVSTSNGDITINPNGTGDIVLDANVGIGTSSPQQFLHVHGANGRMQITSTGTGSASGDGALFGYDGSDDLFINNREATNFKIFNNGSERMRIDSSGRLLSGLTSSSSDARINLVGRPSNPANGARLHLGAQGASPTSGYNLGVLDFGNESGTSGAFVSGWADANWSSGSSHPSRLTFATTASSESSPTERVRIDSSGRVGIGTLSPTRDLEVSKAGNAFIRAVNSTSSVNIDILAGSSAAFVGPQSNHPLAFQTNNTERMRITSAGLVGIGVTSPTNTLHVVDTNGTDGSIDFGPTSNRGRLYASSSGIFFGSTSNHAVIFRTNNTEQMRIASNGVVTVKNGAVAEIDTLTSGTTITPDFAASCNFTVTLGHNATIANPSNLTAGQSGSIFIVQDGTGSRTASWGSYFDWAGGTAPTLTTAGGSCDRIDYIVRSSTSIHAVATLNYS